MIYLEMNVTVEDIRVWLKQSGTRATHLCH